MIQIQRVILVLLISIPFCSIIVKGQNANYFPLQVGNVWQYEERTDGPMDGIVFTYLWDPISVREQITVGESEFFVIENSIYMADTLRVNESGNVVALDQGIEKVLFDFSTPDNGEYSYFSARDSIEFVVTLKENQQVEAPAGNFTKCVSLNFRAIGILDGSPYYVFCPNSGVAFTVRGFGSMLWLYRGSIDGEVITNLEKPERSTPFFFSSPFPNPASTEVQLPFNVGSGGEHVKMVLLDNLGREKAVITNQFHNAGRYVKKIDVSKIPSGFYAVKAQVGLSSYYTSFIVRR